MRRSVQLLTSFSSLFVLLLLSLHPSAQAATRIVQNLNDSGAGSLRDTIAASASGDSIIFGVFGTIQLTSDKLSVNVNLNIIGPGPGQLTIARVVTNDFRIFYFDNGTWSLSGVTITNGYDTLAGGGIYNGNGNLTVSNCVITGCNAAMAGAFTT